MRKSVRGMVLKPSSISCSVWPRSSYLSAHNATENNPSVNSALTKCLTKARRGRNENGIFMAVWLDYREKRPKSRGYRYCIANVDDILCRL